MPLKIARSRKQIYKSRSKRSRCRGRKMSTCTRSHGCSKTRGKKRTYCRKMGNRKVGSVRMASLI